MMINESKVKSELIITETKLPILRAGFGNVIIVFLLGSIFMGVIFVKEFNSPILVGVFLLFFIAYCFYFYCTHVARITFYNNSILILTAVQKVIIRIDDINSIKLATFPTSHVIILIFKLKNKLLTSSFNMVFLSGSNFGSYEITVTKIEELISEYNIPYKKSFDLMIPLRKFMNTYFFKSS